MGKKKHAQRTLIDIIINLISSGKNLLNIILTGFQYTIRI